MKNQLKLTNETLSECKTNLLQLESKHADLKNHFESENNYNQMLQKRHEKLNKSLEMYKIATSPIYVKALKDFFEELTTCTHDLEQMIAYFLAKSNREHTYISNPNDLSGNSN